MGLAVGDTAGELLAPGLSVPVEESVLSGARIPVLLGLCVGLAVPDTGGVRVLMPVGEMERLCEGLPETEEDPV